jgi:curved DNA-binding protein CbpA
LATVKTLYTALGLDATSSAQDIDEAFTRAKIRHPQAKLDADDALRIQFQAIQQAYATLSDPDLRAAYDKRLARTGIKVSGDHLVAESSSTTRNIIIAGVIVLLASGMWAYNAHQRTKAEKEIAERALKLVEDERRREAEAAVARAERADQDRQMRMQDQERRSAEARERQFQMDSQRVGSQAASEMRRASQQADMEKRRSQMEQQNAERQRQMQTRQQEIEAQRRLQQEKLQLQQMCMQRYGRPDC